MKKTFTLWSVRIRGEEVLEAY